MFVMRLFQWYKGKRATSVLSATALTLLPVSATCSVHRAISVSAFSSLFITLFPDLIKTIDYMLMKPNLLVLFDRETSCLMLTFV